MNMPASNIVCLAIKLPWAMISKHDSQGKLADFQAPGNQELTILHRNEFIDSQRDLGRGCIRWVIWILIVEAVLCIAIGLCWRLWSVVT
jgi:hypothetical protein